MKPRKPHALLDALIESEKLVNDARLAGALGVVGPQISKIRHGQVPVSDTIRVAIQRKFRWSLKRIDELAPPAAAAE